MKKDTDKPDLETTTPPPVEYTDATEIKSLPPAGGQFAVPNIQEFVSIVNLASKVYRNPDEAIRHSRQNAKAMRRDLVILEPLKSRMLATAELPWHIQPEDAKDDEQVYIAKELEKILDDIPYWLQYKMVLLEAIWFGTYAIQNKYIWDFSDKGKKRLKIKDWLPIHGDTLEFRWDSDEVGLLVNPNKITEGMRHLSTIPTDVSRAHILTPWEREAFVVHHHEKQGGDFFEPDAAGAAVRGIGLRTWVYWTWYIKHEALGWLTEYMERVGTGLTIYYYDSGNPASEKAVREAAESQAFNNIILWPRSIGPEMVHLPPIERIEPNPAGVENLMRIIDDYFGGLIKRFILGSTHSGSAKQYQGAAQANLEEDTFGRIVKFDAMNLQETLNRDLVSVLMKYNFPQYDFKMKFKFNVDKPDPEQFLKAARAYYDMGGDVDADELREVIGLSKPTNDSVILRRAITDFEAAQGVGALHGQEPGDGDGGEKKPGEGGKGSKKQAIQRAIEELGPQAGVGQIKQRAEEISGQTISYTSAYNIARDLRGARTYQGKGNG